ncbi:hypothetical protein UFOVP123_38 [uncultured Caudovirales phage]|uniref:Large polyvalent protein associated domain-containing protein n=1 Tax=uncultured Caudovirales phage TaxID=2100421 RepID=A0A6J5LA46_9CAUD|nr:hypothetical protein UFOVP123_38 [uncultured Caudovirales phage]
MALDFSSFGTRVEEDDKPDFSNFGTPVDTAKRELPEGVRPSEAGGGRGVVNPPVVDNRGIIQRVGDFLKPEYKSVLEGTTLTPQEEQADIDRRLSYGAGPISRETEAKADFSRSGMLASEDKTVNKVAEAMKEKGQPSFADLIERANNPANVRAARDAKAAEFRTVGEWTADTLSALAQGGTSLVQLPTNIIAPGSKLGSILRETQKELQGQESGVLKAQREQLRERVENEDGFLGKYFATVESLVTNPALGLSEAAKQVPNFLGVLGLAKVGSAIAGGTVGLAGKVSPTIALGEAISGGAIQAGARTAGATAGGLAATTVMTSGDAAGNVYEKLIDPKQTPRSIWEKNPDYQKLIADGKSPSEAIDEIATAKARLAAVIVAPLGALGFMGAEATMVARGAGKALSDVATPKGAAKVFAKELVGEQIEEGGTQLGGNVVAKTIDERQNLMEGVPEAMATAAVTSAPYSGVAVGQQVRDELNRPAPVVDQVGDAIARRMLDVQSYDQNIISPTRTANLQVAQDAFKTATNVDDLANAAGVMAGSVDELLVPGNAVTPLPIQTEPIDLGIEPGGRVEPALTTPITTEPVSTELPPVNAETEQQFGLDKLRLNTPRPQRIQGEPVANLTDDQLTTIASDETAPAITRRSAAVELTARQGEQTAAGAAIETPARAEAAQVTAPAVEAPVESRTLTQTELGQMRLGDRRTLARDFDQTENPDGSITFTRKPTAATPAAQTNAAPVAETFITIPDTTPGVQAVSDAAAPTVAGIPDAPRARATAQASLDQWAAANGVTAPQLNAPAPEQETAVNDIANALGSQFGGKVVAFTDTSPTAPNGFAIGGTAFVNTATDVNVMRTSLHEFKHTVEQIAAAETAAGQTDTPAQKFTASIDSVFDDMTPEGKRAYVENFLHADELAGIADPVAREQRVQALLSSDNLKSEMTADFLGNRATDKRFWASVAKADPQGFKGFVDKWVGVIDNLLNTLRGNANQKTKESAKVDTYIRDLNKAKMVARDALVAYRNGTLQQVATTAPAFSQVQGEQNEQRIDVTAGSAIAPAGAGPNGQVLGAGGGGPAPSYGTARQGAVSVVGRHYSTAPRQILSGAYYGRGLKGAERNRLDSSPDPRLKNRIYFYVDQGAGVRPEAGVGGVAHEVNLQNIYDPKTRLIKPQADANAFESAVINAGFDGYIAPFGNNQSAVVLLGMKHKAVPVRALGQVPSAPAPQAAAPTKLTKGLLSREANAIDVSKIPGAQVRMGNLEIPAEQSEAANTELARIGSDVRFSKKEVPEDIDSFARLENIIPRAREGSYNTNRELKVDLQTAITNAAKQAKIDLAAQNAQTEKYLVRVGVADAMYAIQSNANAVGWYDKTVTKALKILGKIHPEIDTDPNAKFAFTWALAVTSNGLKVDKNFELAERAYKAYKTTGKMPTNIQGGQAQKAINDGLGLFNTMVQQYGIDNVRKFMDSKFAVSQIKRATGLEVTGEFADTQVRGAAVLGPKIGNGFYSNLNGFFDQLTMDRWLMRTWGRWTGTLIESRPDMVKAKRQELRDLVVKMKQNAPAAAEFQKALGTKLNVGDLDGLAAAIQKASMDPATREQFNKTATGESLRKTGNALAKYMDGQKEAPAGPEERNFIRKVFGQILTEVQKDHPALTMSDLQALLWYPEKRLYDIAKADESANKEEGYSDDEAPDYANAAAKLARGIGVSDANIQSAVAEAEKDYENRVSAGRAGPSAGAGNEAGATPGVRGFSQREGRSFLTTGVIDRIRSAGAGDEGQPNSYTRKSGGDGKGLRVLNIPSVAVYGPATTFKNALGEIPAAAPKFFEVGADGASAFRDSIQSAKDRSPFGAAVYVYDQADYEGMRLFLAEDGKAGFALKGDDIVSVFAGEPHNGAVNAILQLATQEGGRRLDAFDTVLPNMYAVHGFRAVARTKWNDEYSPDGWNKETFKEFNNGEPDVVFMVHDPKYFGMYSKADGETIAEYDDGAKAQAEALADIKQVRQTDKPKPVNPATIFANLDKRGLARTKGEAALKDHPDAARIQFVQDNFLDILSELDDAGTVKINCD